jgi:type IX secretion system PorP/SprF family membrane protein
LFADYTYAIKINYLQEIVFGLGGGGILLKSDYSKVHTIDEDNQFYSSKSILRPDFRFGVYFLGKNYDFGFAMPSLIHNTIVNNNGDLQGKTSFMAEYWEYYLHGGYQLELNREYSLYFSSLAKLAVNAPPDIDFNVQLQYDKLFGGGISYRTQKEILFYGNVRINDVFRICYTYHNYFNISGRYLTGHEIILTFTGTKSKPAVIQNPRF